MSEITDLLRTKAAEIPCLCVWPPNTQQHEVTCPAYYRSELLSLIPAIEERIAAEREKVLEEAVRSFEDEYMKQESMAMGLIRGLKAIRALGGPR